VLVSDFDLSGGTIVLFAKEDGTFKVSRTSTPDVAATTDVISIQQYLMQRRIHL
jgi:hypothetical protein